METQIRFRYFVDKFLDNSRPLLQSRTLVVVTHNDFQDLMRGINDAVVHKLGIPSGVVVELTNTYGDVITERSYSSMVSSDQLTATVAAQPLRSRMSPIMQ